MSAGHHDLVERQFGAQAKAYVQSAAHASGPDLERMAAVAAALGGTARALDLGCGGGHATYAVAPHVGSVTACDLLPAMLEAVAAESAKRGLGPVETAQAPAEALPFDDGSFDLLVCRLTAHHWRGWEAGLAEARRVLRRGAPALFVDTVAPDDALADTHLQAVELLRDPSHVRDRSVAEWRDGLARAGFAVESAAVHRLTLDFASWIQRMRTPDANAAAIRAIWAAAPPEVRAHFAVEADGSFAIEVALVEARAA